MNVKKKLPTLTSENVSEFEGEWFTSIVVTTQEDGSSKHFIFDSKLVIKDGKLCVIRINPETGEDASAYPIKYASLHRNVAIFEAKYQDEAPAPDDLVIEIVEKRKEPVLN